MKKFTIVAVIQDRTLKVTSDGTEAGTVFEGQEFDVKKASAVARLGFHIPMGVDGMSDIPTVKAGYDSPIGLAAAMMSVAPQYVYFWRAPDEVKELMTSFDRETVKLRRAS